MNNAEKQACKIQTRNQIQTCAGFLYTSIMLPDEDQVDGTSASSWLTDRRREAAALRIKGSLVETLFEKHQNSSASEAGRWGDLLEVKLPQREEPPGGF